MIPGIKRPGMDYHQPAWKYKSSSGRRGKNRVVIRKERILKLLRRSIRGIIVEAISIILLDREHLEIRQYYYTLDLDYYEINYFVDEKE